MTLFLFGLTSGATVLTAQYWGKGDRKTIEKILGMTVKAAVLVTAVFTAAALVIPAVSDDDIHRGSCRDRRRSEVPAALLHLPIS